MTSWTHAFFLPLAVAVALSANAADAADAQSTANTPNEGAASAADADDDADDDDADGDEDTSATTATVLTQPRVLVTDVTGDIPESDRILITNVVAARLSRFANLKVIAQRDLKQRLGLEADKQLAGCESDSACLAELAGAFDVDLVAISAVGQLGGTIVYTLQLVDKHGGAAARGTASVSALDDLVAAISDVVDTAGRTVTGDEPSDPVVAVAADVVENPVVLPLRIGGGAALGVGVIAAVVGTLPALAYRGAEGQLADLREDYLRSGDTAFLDAAAEQQAAADRSRAAWNGAGIYAVWGGVVLAVAGAGAVAASFLLTEEAP
jgi:hypothetical protein